MHQFFFLLKSGATQMEIKTLKYATNLCDFLEKYVEVK